MPQSTHVEPSPTLDATTAAPGVGRFVWHDLVSTDPTAAIAFYSALFGWTTKTIPMGEMGDYVILHAGGEAVGGVVPLDPRHGVASHWIGYATVPSVDAACEAAERSGGTVCVPPTEIPNEVGRFAVIEDPTGAVISPFNGPGALEAPELDGPPPLGIFVWDELLSPDPEASARFHSAVFGWRYETMDFGPLGTYWLGYRGDVQAAGMMTLPAEALLDGARPHWLSYVHVADVDAAAARAVELGAAQLVAPADIPEVGRFAVLMDPAGAVFAVFRNLAA